jgi:hypothetical protein
VKTCPDFFNDSHAGLSALRERPNDFVGVLRVVAVFF